MPSGGDTSAVGTVQKASAVPGSVSQQNFQNGENQPSTLKRRSLSFRLKDRLPFTKAKAERKRAMADQVVVCVLNPASNVAEPTPAVSSEPDEIVVTIRFLDDSVPLALRITVCFYRFVFIMQTKLSKLYCTIFRNILWAKWFWIEFANISNFLNADISGSDTTILTRNGYVIVIVQNFYIFIFDKHINDKYN